MFLLSVSSDENFVNIYCDTVQPMKEIVHGSLKDGCGRRDSKRHSGGFEQTFLRINQEVLSS